MLPVESIRPILQAGVHHLASCEPCVRDPNLPAGLRLGFVKKVYGIVVSMLVTSFVAAAPFLANGKESLAFVENNVWVVAVPLALLCVHHFINVAVWFDNFCDKCCGAGEFRRRYLHMFVKVPLNYMFLFCYALCFGILLGAICAKYQTQSVLFAFLATVGIVVSLTAYAVFAQHPFTGCSIYAVAIANSTLFLLLLQLLVPCSLLNKLMAVVVAVFMSFVIIYDTQLIVGSASLNLGPHFTRRTEFTLDMYAFAAYQVYLDFLNVFLYALNIFGQRRA